MLDWVKYAILSVSQNHSTPHSTELETYVFLFFCVWLRTAYSYINVCVCVCVCKREREREKKNYWHVALCESFFFFFPLYFDNFFENSFCFMLWALWSKGEMTRKRMYYYYYKYENISSTQSTLRISPCLILRRQVIFWDLEGVTTYIINCTKDKVHAITIHDINNRCNHLIIINTQKKSDELHLELSSRNSIKATCTCVYTMNVSCFCVLPYIYCF